MMRSLIGVSLMVDRAGTDKLKRHRPTPKMAPEACREEVIKLTGTDTNPRITTTPSPQRPGVHRAGDKRTSEKGEKR